MWRYLVGGAAALAMAGGAMLAFGGEPRAASVLPAKPEVQGTAAGEQAMPDGPLPEAAPKTREQKRFGRYDKDRDGAITRDEYMASRRKAYGKLDRDGDGRLSFDEWSAKTAAKFQTADADRSGAMNAAEFATTAVKRRPARACPPQPQADEG